MNLLSTHSEKLSCKLTEREVREKGQRLAALQGDLANHSAHSDDVKSQLKATEKRISAQITEVAAVIRSGSELRETTVDVYEDGGEALEIRRDTNEVVTKRALRDDERQRCLFEKEPAEEGEEGEGDEQAQEGTEGAPAEGAAPTQAANVVDGVSLDGKVLLKNVAPPETPEGSAPAPQGDGGTEPF
jgi:chromosome segregation ATPase